MEQQVVTEDPTVERATVFINYDDYGVLNVGTNAPIGLDQIFNMVALAKELVANGALQEMSSRARAAEQHRVAEAQSPLLVPNSGLILPGQ